MGAVSARRSTFWRYTALQVPGWVLALAAGWWIHRSFDGPGWLVPGIPLAWVVKDMALYPLLRSAYEVDETPPVERLIGRRGIAMEPLAPSGYVRIGGELWRARAADEIPIGPHLTVEVVGARGLVLAVRHADPQPDDGSATS
jgi:membrane protein implicated in regulation of membrane protease activity